MRSIDSMKLLIVVVLKLIVITIIKPIKLLRKRKL